MFNEPQGKVVCMHMKFHASVSHPLHIHREVRLLQCEMLHISKCLYKVHNFTLKYCNFVFGNCAVVVLADC
jgi:hypothetical protein